MVGVSQYLTRSHPALRSRTSLLRRARASKMRSGLQHVEALQKTAKGYSRTGQQDLALALYDECEQHIQQLAKFAKDEQAADLSYDQTQEIEREQRHGHAHANAQPGRQRSARSQSSSVPGAHRLCTHTPVATTCSPPTPSLPSAASANSKQSTLEEPSPPLGTEVSQFVRGKTGYSPCLRSKQSETRSAICLILTEKENEEKRVRYKHRCGSTRTARKEQQQQNMQQTKGHSQLHTRGKASCTLGGATSGRSNGGSKRSSKGTHEAGEQLDAGRTSVPVVCKTMCEKRAVKPSGPKTRVGWSHRRTVSTIVAAMVAV